MATEVMASWHLCRDKLHILQALMIVCSFLESGAWARLCSSSSQADVVTAHLCSQFLVCRTKSKFLCKENKSLHCLPFAHVPIFIFCHLSFSLLPYSSSCSLWTHEDVFTSHVSALLHICTYCSLTHSLALLMRMANFSSFKCCFKHDFFLLISS